MLRRTTTSLRLAPPARRITMMAEEPADILARVQRMSGSSSQSPAAAFSHTPPAAASSLEGDSVEAILARATAMSTGTYVPPGTVAPSLEGDSVQAILARATAMSTGTYTSPVAAQSAALSGQAGERATATVLKKMQAYANKQSKARAPASPPQALAPDREKLLKLSAITAIRIASSQKAIVGKFFKRTAITALLLGVSFFPIFIQPALQTSQVATRVFSAVIGLAFCVHCFLAYKDLKKTTKRK